MTEMGQNQRIEASRHMSVLVPTAKIDPNAHNVTLGVKSRHLSVARRNLLHRDAARNFAQNSLFASSLIALVNFQTIADTPPYGWRYECPHPDGFEF